ncbi:hypothetical protein CPC08DRAFT_808302 [Agrocybe pediades]|nr:hypothetical protein CPC08DRAFT_808302 [Agrocybe pediades]
MTVVIVSSLSLLRASSAVTVVMVIVPMAVTIGHRGVSPLKVLPLLAENWNPRPSWYGVLCGGKENPFPEPGPPDMMDIGTSSPSPWKTTRLVACDSAVTETETPALTENTTGLGSRSPGEQTVWRRTGQNNGRFKVSDDPSFWGKEKSASSLRTCEHAARLADCANARRPTSGSQTYIRLADLHQARRPTSGSHQARIRLAPCFLMRSLKSGHVGGQCLDYVCWTLLNYIYHIFGYLIMTTMAWCNERSYKKLEHVHKRGQIVRELQDRVAVSDRGNDYEVLYNSGKREQGSLIQYLIWTMISPTSQFYGENKFGPRHLAQKHGFGTVDSAKLSKGIDGFPAESMPYFLALSERVTVVN